MELLPDRGERNAAAGAVEEEAPIRRSSFLMIWLTRPWASPSRSAVRRK
ncbi:hypothetical protein ACFQQB_12215 [Nonomuraea rubra]